MDDKTVERTAQLLREYAIWEVAAEQCRRELNMAGVTQSASFWVWVCQAIAEKQKSVGVAIAALTPSGMFRQYGKSQAKK
jgi:hypothetical protein